MFHEERVFTAAAEEEPALQILVGDRGELKAKRRRWGRLMEDVERVGLSMDAWSTETGAVAQRRSWSRGGRRERVRYPYGALTTSQPTRVVLFRQPSRGLAFEL